AKEIFDKFDLEELLINQNINGEYCPTCQAKGESNFIVHKYSRQNRQFFYGCESYPECDFTANIKINTLEDVKQRSTGTRKKRPSPNKQKTQRQLTSTNNEAQKDLFGIETAGRQWESKLLYWSSVELPGYTYSNKKNAWWKSK
ncbi:MAG: topoisomerase DNA-binding C4 zinc finger domain-containing protein, partial [Chitinophagales bacterium]|nr:topoisomerase DNA-binding C4 zinc finger domain-containing protein [Chitinophagales bacterium]